MNERELRLPPPVYRLRLFGLGLGFLCIGTVFYERGASVFAWRLLAAHGCVWPHPAGGALFFFDVPAAAAGVSA